MFLIKLLIVLFYYKLSKNPFNRKNSFQGKQKIQGILKQKKPALLLVKQVH